MKKQLPDPKFVAVDAEGNPGDLSVLEENDIAFDPTRTTIDLTKDEKRRTTALMLAIQAYQNLIIKDADYLREAVNHERNGGPVIKPATMNAMVEAAINFDSFIAGHFSMPANNAPGGGVQTEAPADGAQEKA